MFGVLEGEFGSAEGDLGSWVRILGCQRGVWDDGKDLGVLGWCLVSCGSSGVLGRNLGGWWRLDSGGGGGGVWGVWGGFGTLGGNFVRAELAFGSWVRILGCQRGVWDDGKDLGVLGVVFGVLWEFWGAGEEFGGMVEVGFRGEGGGFGGVGGDLGSWGGYGVMGRDLGVLRVGGFEVVGRDLGCQRGIWDCGGAFGVLGWIWGDEGIWGAEGGQLGSWVGFWGAGGF